MSTVVTSAPAVPSSVLGRLTRIEALRYAKHPLFLVGFVLALASSGTYGPVELDHQVVPAFFLGVLGIVVGNRLVSGSERSAPVIDAAPVSETLRTAALCLACLVPGAAGVVVVLVHRAFVQLDPPAAYEYAGYDGFDRFLITMAVPVVACVGGPLLGVAAGRWLRFRGAAVLTVILVWLWSSRFGYISHDSASSNLVSRVLHLLTPYTPFLGDQRREQCPTDVGHLVHGLPVLVPRLDRGALWARRHGRAAARDGRRGAQDAARVVRWLGRGRRGRVGARRHQRRPAPRPVHARRSVARPADVVR